MKNTKSFAGSPCELSAIRKFVDGYITDGGVPEQERCLIVLAVDEACSNIIKYAYADEEPGPIEIDVECGKQAVRITLRDYGNPVDPASLKGRSLEDVRPGGLGLHFIRCAFDHVEYEPLKDGTRLVLRKEIAADEKSTTEN